MIAVELAWRMGNEMFIYAFALSAARRLKYPFALLYDFDDPRLFQLPSYFDCASLRPGVNRFLTKIFGRFKRLFPRQMWDSSDEPEAQLARWRRERNEPITDLQLLANADIAVRSNSSFAWWRGYLGKPDRTVFAPDKWLGFKARYESPRGICSMPWRWMNVPKDVRLSL